MFTIAGTLPEARAPPDKAWQPRWTLCCGATKVCWLGAQKLRSTAAQHAATTSTGRLRLWEAIESKLGFCFWAWRKGVAWGCGKKIACDEENVDHRGSRAMLAGSKNVDAVNFSGQKRDGIKGPAPDDFIVTGLLKQLSLGRQDERLLLGTISATPCWELLRLPRVVASQGAGRPRHPLQNDRPARRTRWTPTSSRLRKGPSRGVQLKLVSATRKGLKKRAHTQTHTHANCLDVCSVCPSLPVNGSYSVVMGMDVQANKLVLEDLLPV